MPFKFSSLVTDEKLERDGVWHPLGDGGEILVARAMNPEHEAIVAELEREWRASHPTFPAEDELPREVVKEHSIVAMARGLLKGFRGIVDDEGREITYDPDTAEAMLRASRDFQTIVTRVAVTAANFRAKKTASTVGN